MRETPEFWQDDGVLPRLLSPLSIAVAAATRRRVARGGWRAPVPVVCCGNAGVGGAGKTTVVLDLAARLQAWGMKVHCLTRGYGGRVQGVLRVDPLRHRADLVGDEPLLLAKVAPTWVSADRAEAARAAVAAGAQCLLMDDGLQNSTLEKTASLMVIDGAVGFGNGRVMPAGPLREPVERAAARCCAALLIGPDAAQARAVIPTLPVLSGWLEPTRRLDGVRVFAFCGIARPSKFLDTVQEAGAELVGSRTFPDHHPFSPDELTALVADAAARKARLLTTAKDAVRLRLPVRAKVDVLDVRLMWRNEAALERLLDEILSWG